MSQGPLPTRRPRLQPVEDALLALNPDALIVTDPLTRIVHWNAGAEAVFGHREQDALERPLVELLFPGDRAREVERALPGTRGCAADSRLEAVALRADGSLIHVDFVTRAFQGTGPGHVLWVGRDVTQPRLTQAARHLEARYGELLESTPDGMLLVGETGHIVLANGNAERMFGYDPGELQGVPVDALVPHRVREVHVGRRAGYVNQPRVRAMGGGAELLGRRKSGEEFPVEVSLSPLRTDDGLVVISAVRDVSDRLNATRRFRALLEAAPDAIVITDSQGRIVLANSQTDSLFGYSREELIGQKVEVLLPDRLRGTHVAHREGYAAYPKFRAMGAGLELFARHRDGREFPVEVSLSPISTKEGMLTSAAIRDITERKAVQRRLEEQNLELARASEAKTNFLAGMSHELRTPLNAIIGFTGTLLMRLPGPLTDEQEKQLKTVQWAGHHLLALINDLLDLTRIESGETHVDLAPVDGSEAALEAGTQVRSQAEEKGLELELDLPETPVVIRSERRALTQVLMNLLANAVKYTETGRVRLRLRRVDDTVRFEVQDTGIGIRREDRQRLFKAFSRLERGNEKRPGTGLGLYLSGRLAALLGGRIDVHSRVGVGSTFTLVLPGA
ncbi:MAG: putative histidine protein kinase [Steroidobacteraceae bacterium]|nr:putative histidine protein kinase [Steroidobacteraceae bacterium]